MGSRGRVDLVVDRNHVLDTIVFERSQVSSDSVFESGSLRGIEDAIGSLNVVKRVLLRLGVGKWYIGHFKMKRWRAPIPFYVWRCGDCGAIAFGYPLGYTNDLYCNHCSVKR